MPEGQVLEFTNVTKRFNTVTAVSDLSVRVEPGAVTGMLGPNGAGKTTSLRILLGQIKPTSGTATIGGVPYSELRQPLRTVGAVLEEAIYRPRRTATRQLMIAAKANGIPADRVGEVLHLVGLQDDADTRLGSYSLGMRQRLAVANALLGDPGVLVLDEPANGLDPEGIRWMRLLMRRLADEGRTVLVSSHVLSEIEQVADNVVVLSRGRAVYSGSMDELADPAGGAVVVDADDRIALVAALTSAGLSFDLLRSGVTVRGSNATQVGAIAAESGIALTTLQQRGPSLEEVFLDLIYGRRSDSPRLEEAANPVAHAGDARDLGPVGDAALVAGGVPLAGAAAVIADGGVVAAAGVGYGTSPIDVIPSEDAAAQAPADEDAADETPAEADAARESAEDAETAQDGADAEGGDAAFGGSAGGDRTAAADDGGPGGWARPSAEEASTEEASSDAEEASSDAEATGADDTDDEWSHRAATSLTEPEATQDVAADDEATDDATDSGAAQDRTAEDASEGTDDAEAGAESAPRGPETAEDSGAAFGGSAGGDSAAAAESFDSGTSGGDTTVTADDESAQTEPGQIGSGQTEPGQAESEQSSAGADDSAPDDADVDDAVDTADSADRPEVADAPDAAETGDATETGDVSDGAGAPDAADQQEDSAPDTEPADAWAPRAAEATASDSSDDDQRERDQPGVLPLATEAVSLPMTTEVPSFTDLITGIPSDVEESTTTTAAIALPALPVTHDDDDHDSVVDDADDDPRLAAMRTSLSSAASRFFEGPAPDYPYGTPSADDADANDDQQASREHDEDDKRD